MMFSIMWKAVFLCGILIVGDPFVTLKAQTQNYTPVTPVEVAHNTLQI